MYSADSHTELRFGVYTHPSPPLVQNPQCQRKAACAKTLVHTWGVVMPALASR
jgi:hypothetical protein